MNFCEKLHAAMQELGLKQAQVAGLTGKPKSAISQYLSGKNVPGLDGQREIARALGLEADYFGSEEEKIKIVGPIKHISVIETAKLLGVSKDTVYKGLQQGVFPWGYAVKTTTKGWTYIINAIRFAEIERLEIKNLSGPI